MAAGSFTSCPSPRRGTPSRSTSPRRTGLDFARAAELYGCGYERPEDRRATALCGRALAGRRGHDNHRGADRQGAEPGATPHGGRGSSAAAGGGHRVRAPNSPLGCALCALAIVGCGGTSAHTTRQPVFAQSVVLQPVSGTVRVKLAAGTGFTRLQGAEQAGVGTVIDTRAGVVRLTAADPGRGKPAVGDFQDGVFQVLQSRAANGLTELRIEDTQAVGYRLPRRERHQAADGPSARPAAGRRLGPVPNGRRFRQRHRPRDGVGSAKPLRRHAHRRPAWDSDRHGLSPEARPSPCTPGRRIWRRLPSARVIDLRRSDPSGGGAGERIQP